VLNEIRPIIEPPSPKRARTTRGRDFMELWQARCVQGYIAAHLHSKIRTGDLARVTQFKRSKFNRIFKASFGCTPCQYVKRMRVARAQNLMVISSGPLSQVALECGFADQAHFSNCFRSVVGERPAAWRAQRLSDRFTQVATTRPPAARMTSPVIQADSSEARDTASGAISVTRPSRPSGGVPARTAPAPLSKVPAAKLPSVSV
jgi:AraC-like DNA-binding protein